MKDKKKAAAGGGAVLAIIALALAAGAKKVEALPEEESMPGEEAKYTPVIRHPEIPPEKAYLELEVLPISQEEVILSMATKQPIVSPLIDIETTDENRAYIQTVEDTEEARLMALPNGGVCTKSFTALDGNYYTCCNGYAILNKRATTTPEQFAAMIGAVAGAATKEESLQAAGEAFEEAGGETYHAGVRQGEPEGLTLQERAKLEEVRTGYSSLERNRMKYDYSQAHPGVSMAEASKILFG